MKLIGTRIRVEASEHKTEYFPEYCLEGSNWYGSTRQEWFGVSADSSHCFGDAYLTVHVGLAATSEPYGLVWAKGVIDLQARYYKEHLDFNEHQNTKQTSYIKYP